MSELEMTKIKENGMLVRQKLDLAKYIAGCITALAALWIIFNGLATVIEKQDPSGLTALAKVIEAVHIGSILGYVFGIGAVAAWRLERTGKKRAIREKSKYQKRLEKGDHNRTSSGLNDTGDDPEEDYDD